LGFLVQALSPSGVKHLANVGFRKSKLRYVFLRYRPASVQQCFTLVVQAEDLLIIH
jgi:hypothetical protein